jgi:hypothetical protein
VRLQHMRQGHDIALGTKGYVAAPSGFKFF